MKHIISPPFVGSLQTPWSAGLALHWHVTLFFFSAYFFLLSIYLMLGQSPVDITAKFFIEGFDVISPLLENTVGYWLLISYLYSAISPLSFGLLGNSTIPYVGTDVLWTVAVVVELLLTWLLATLLFSPNNWDLCTKLSRLPQFPPPNSRILLEEGWTPGGSPHILYEQLGTSLFRLLRQIP